MPNPGQDPKPRQPARSEADPAIRPKIWIEGRQQPRFHLGAWASVSLTMTRRDLGPVMTGGAVRIDSFGQAVARGDHVPNLAWAGRARRLIPSHQGVGRLIVGLAHLLADAREVVLPAPPPEEPVAYPNLIRPNFATTPGPATLAEPAQSHRPAIRPPTLQVVGPSGLHAVAAPSNTQPTVAPVSAPADETTLRAIRSLIGTPEAQVPSRPRPPRAREQAASDAPAAPVSPSLLQKAGAAVAGVVWRGLVQAVAWGLIGLSFPRGAVRATLFHLDGGDLRDWT